MENQLETVSIDVPEIRDYERVNLEILRNLELGVERIELKGVERQRLLVAGLRTNRQALIVVQGSAGPDLAAGLDAPRLKVLCRGDAAEGAGHSLAAGFLHVLGNVGSGVGYAQKGGAILVEGNAGPRAGLNQSGGMLAILGELGNLARERQSGGIFAAHALRLGPNFGRSVQPGGRYFPLDRGRIEDLEVDFPYRREILERLQSEGDDR